MNGWSKGAICGLSSPPVYGDMGFTCTLPPDHEGDHKAIAPGLDGEVYHTWKMADPMQTDRLLRAIFPERFGPLPRKRKDTEGDDW